MAKKTYHILNGDALKMQFPNSIEGEQIIMRECLVDGPVNGKTLNDFFLTRATYLEKSYNEPKDFYNQKVIPEIEKIAQLPKTETIVLWFEEDLFCQVNLWFLLNLLNSTSEITKHLYLAMPPKKASYGFGSLSQKELEEVYINKKKVLHHNQLSTLWENYRDKDTNALLKTASSLESHYPFLKNAVQTYIKSLPSHTSRGEPTEIIASLLKENNTKTFGFIFQEFTKKHPEYGYGDLLVHKIYTSLVSN